MFYILNRTRNTRREWTSENWPAVSMLVSEDFASPGDTLELVSKTTDNLVYHGLQYVHDKVYTYGMERVSSDGSGYVAPRQRAADWLAEAKSPAGLILPSPRCGKCLVVFEEIPDVQCIRDSGLCPGCRVPKHDVIVPRPAPAKKKK